MPIYSPLSAFITRGVVTRVIAPQDKLQVAGMNSKLRFVIEFFSESVNDLSSVGIQVFELVAVNNS